ncbi:MerR family transcriptional regulator [Microbacterium arabinogalactanolyticum]|uniref:MerR family transcriptional regulator n=1 Tax=Microbacterium arabinogalactanolyticum TaxID=69365 RepID=UPI004043993E
MAPTRDPADMPLPQQQRLQTIGTFASAAGLSTSALRQYGESGLLVPCEIEERTGYRYYAPDQLQRAIWIRRLRDAGLTLRSIRTVLEGDLTAAEAVLDEWSSDARNRSDEVTELVADVKLGLRTLTEPNPSRLTRARLDAAVLASAIRQVSAVADPDDADFGGVLIETGADSASVVATNRYLLLARMRLPAAVNGPPARVVVHADALLDWLHGRHEVELVLDVPIGRDARVPRPPAQIRDAQDAVLPLAALPDRLPHVSGLLPVDWSTERRCTRMLVSREQVASLASAGPGDAVRLAPDRGRALLTVGDRHVTAHSDGPVRELRLSRSCLRLIADAAVGAELVCDVRGEGDALVWRAPAQPDFVALVMPRSA